MDYFLFNFSGVQFHYTMSHKLVREAFIELYTEHDVLAEFKESLQYLVTKELPAPPKKGELDLNIIRDSKYIFC